MAQDVEIRIKAAVEGAQAAQTLGALKKALTELQSVAEETEIGTQQFQNLQTQIAATTNQLAQTSDRLGDVGDKLRTLTGTPVERLNASFGLLKDSIFNLDLDKAKIAVDGLVNSFTPLGPNGVPLQGLKAMGPVLSNLGTGVMSLGSTFLQLGRTILTNPIFLLASTIAVIGVAIVGLLNKLGLLTPILNAIGSAVEYVTDTFNSLTQAIGLSTAASDKHLKTISDNAEQERNEIQRTYALRETIATSLEGLDSRQIAQIQKVTGMYLQQDKTLSDIQRERLNLMRDNISKEITEYERIQKANRGLNDDQKKKLEELRDKYQKTSNEIVDIEVKRLKSITDLENKNQEMRIAAIGDDAERARAQAKYQVEEAQKTRDLVAILLEKERTATNNAERESARRQINALTQERMLLEQKAEREKNEKLGEIYKQNLENQKKFAQEGLRNVELLGKIAVEKQIEGSKERVDAEIKALNDIYDYREKNRKLLEISDKQLELDNLERLKRIKKLEEEYQKSTYATRKEMAKNAIDEINAELDRFSSTLVDKSRKIALPLTSDVKRQMIASTENIKAAQIDLQRELLKQTKELLKVELQERINLNKITAEEKDKFAAQIFAIDEKLYQNTQQRLNLQYEITRASYEKEAEAYKILQEKKFENIKTFTKADANQLVLQSAMRSIALKNAFKDEIALREKAFMEKEMINKATLNSDKELQEKLAEFNLATITEYNNRRKEIEKQTADDIKKLNESIYQENKKQRDEELAKTNDLGANRIAVVRNGLKETLDDMRMFQGSETSMLAQSYMDRNNITYAELKNDKDLFAQFTAEKSEIDKRYNEERILATEESAQKIADIRAKEAQQIYGITEGLTSTLSILQDVALADQTAKAKGNAVEEEKIAKKKFEFNKGLQVALAVADGYRAATTYIASNPLFTLGVPNPLAIVGLGITIAQAAANVAKILATKFETKSFSAPSTSIGAGANTGGGAGTTQPTFTPGQFFGLGGQQPVNVGVGGPNIVGPQKVYVVETDITSAQRNVRGIEQRAEIQ